MFSHLVLDLTQTHLKQVKYWVDHTLGLVGWTTCLSAILEPNLDLEFLIKCCYSQFIHDTIFKHFPQWHLNINTIKKLFLTTWVMTYQPEAIRMLFLFFFTVALTLSFLMFSCLPLHLPFLRVKIIELRRKLKALELGKLKKMRY